MTVIIIMILIIANNDTDLSITFKGIMHINDYKSSYRPTIQ